MTDIDNSKFTRCGFIVENANKQIENEYELELKSLGRGAHTDQLIDACTKDREFSAR